MGWGRECCFSEKKTHTQVKHFDWRSEMNIKSLLLGSAAALAVVSGAQAADAVVAAEPEPMEYVKVCDAYGTGYFYIPGTETCLKIGGKVRFDVQAANSYEFNSAQGWRTRSRAEITADTASDTEYGALKTSIVTRFDFDGTYNDGSHTNVSLIAANISLAGFTVGEADSVFTTFTGYAGDIINDDVVSYGGFEVNQISYAFDSGSGFTAAISVQDDRGAAIGASRGGTTIYDNGHDYAPDVVGGVGYTMGDFAFKVVGGYDESEEEGAVKARVDGTFGQFSAFVMGAWSSSGNLTNAFAPGDSYGAWGDWAAWAGVGAKFSDSLAANVQVSGTDNKTFAAAANLKFYPVSGLLIMPEVTYTNWDSVDKDQWNGMLRFERSF
jgi:hypothetical protein